MRLSYKHVLRLFTDILGVDPAKSIALTGRLKHFQRAGFPGGTNVGPGPRAAYGIVEVLALAFAFRLLALRYTPRDAITAVDANMEVIRKAALQAWDSRSGRTDDREQEGPLLLLVAADGLEDLRRPDFGAGPADAMREVDQRQVWAWMRGVDPLPQPGLVLIDPEAVVREVLGAVTRLELASIVEVERGFHLLRTARLTEGEAMKPRWEA